MIYQSSNRKVFLVLDPALSINPNPVEKTLPILQRLGLNLKTERTRPLIGINFRYVGDPLVDNKVTLEETVKLVRYLINHRNMDVLFLAISQHPNKHFEDDLDFGYKVQKHLRLTNNESGYYILNEYPPPQTFMAMLGQMDAMILTRLHAVIFAAKMGIPTLIISYDDKVTQFAKISGQEDTLIKLHEYSFEKTKRHLKNICYIASGASLFLASQAYLHTDILRGVLRAVFT